jgi:hypothetical protein
VEGHNFERLKAYILPLSVSKRFDLARTEWSLIAAEISEEFDQCPCGQDIKEHCYIRNRLNGNETYVGNVCINRFIQIDTGNLFDGLKRIAKDLTPTRMTISSSMPTEWATSLGRRNTRS